MVYNPDDYGKLIFNNHASTDFGIMVKIPWDPVTPTADGTDTHVTGRSGNLWQSNNNAYNNVTETFNCKVFRDPNLFADWWELHDAISNWLTVPGGGYDYLEFDLYPEWAFYAQPKPFNLTTIDTTQADLTLQFNCSPLMTSIRGMDWKKYPTSGLIYNSTSLPVKPKWHVKGNGDYYLNVNGFDYYFDDVEDDLYLTPEGNAFYYDSSGAKILANEKIRLANNGSPVFLCGKNTVEFKAQDNPAQPDEDGVVAPATKPGSIEYKALWKKVIM